MQNYQCPNVGSCQLADDHTIIELATGNDTKCSECNTTLKELASSSDHGTGLPTWVKLTAAAGIVVIGAGVAFSMLGRSTPKPAESAPSTASAPATQKIASTPTALSPSTGKAAAGASYPDNDITAQQNCAGKAQEQGKTQDARACLDGVKAQVAVNEAVMHLQKGELDLAQTKLDEALKANPKDNLAHYNQAVLAALRNEPEQAARHLQSSIDNGFKQIYLVEKDPDMASVLQHPAVRAVLNKALNGQTVPGKQ